MLIWKSVALDPPPFGSTYMVREHLGEPFEATVSIHGIWRRVDSTYPQPNPSFLFWQTWK